MERSTSNTRLDGLTRGLEARLGLAGFAERENRVVVHAGLALAAAAVVIRLVFWAYTQRYWEDALITTLHAENFARGLGLTHVRPDQPPLHGFTSPLSVLVPLVGDLVRVGWGVEFIKVVGALCGAIAVLYAAGIAVHPKTKLPVAPAVLLMGYLAFEHHQILWGMAGMETQIVTAILLASCYYVIADRPVALGLSLGLCMLARPDFAFWTVVVGGYLLIRRPGQLPVVVGVALAVYLPWIVFTTLYYGSPIPHTVYAKSLGYSAWWQRGGWSWPVFKRNVADRVLGSYLPGAVFQPLGPSFSGHGTGFRALVDDGGAIADAMLGLAVLGAVAAFFKRQWELLPTAFFVLVYSLYYVFLVPYVFGWYIVPFVAAAMVLAVQGLTRAGEWLPWEKGRSWGWGVFAALYLGWVVGVLPWTFHAERRIQLEIENPVRKAMGLWLGEAMAEDEYVGCEPLGYVGYYSRRPVYDWPGLNSRTVVEYSRTHPEGRSMNDMLEHLRPEFLVLRFHEYNYLKGHRGGWVERDYEVVKEFRADPESTCDILLVHTNPDRRYVVLRKKPGADGGYSSSSSSSPPSTESN